MMEVPARSSCSIEMEERASPADLTGCDHAHRATALWFGVVVWLSERKLTT